MRMRKKRNLESRIEACSAVNLGWLQDYASEMRGENTPEIITAEKVFGNSNPIHLEIGCGKGQFAEEIAKRNPHINYIAVEQNVNVLVTAMERTRDSGTPNLKYIMGMAEYLEKVFEKGSVQCIYLNFSDPWPKKGYAKRRLTHVGFLELYRGVLKEGGLLRFKTDNEGLFDFSLEQFAEAGLTVEWQTRDLHASERAADNIMTEYERNFSSKGQVIYSAWVRF